MAPPEAEGNMGAPSVEGSEDRMMWAPPRTAPPPALQQQQVQHFHQKGRSEDQGVHQIDDGLFLCAVDELFDTDRLRALGVTHILNIAEESLYDRRERGDLEMIDRGLGPQIPLRELLLQARLQVRCLNTQDVETQDLTPYFEEAHAFIEEVRQSGGRIVVHCEQGRSRGASAVLASLMLRGRHSKTGGLSLACAFRKVFRARGRIRPNNGFWRQLRGLETALQEEGVPLDDRSEPPAPGIGEETLRILDATLKAGIVSEPMQAQILNFHVKPECVDQFMSNNRTVYEEMPGLLLYQVCRDPAVAGDFYFFMLFENRAALKDMNDLVPKMLDRNVDNVMSRPPEALAVPVVGVPVRRANVALDQAGLVVFRTIPARGDKAPEFEEAARAFMPQVTAQEPDTLLCLIAKNRKKEGTYYTVEFYRDEADLAKHEAQGHLQQMEEAQEPYLTGPTSVKTLLPVGRNHGRDPHPIEGALVRRAIAGEEDAVRELKAVYHAGAPPAVAKL